LVRLKLRWTGNWWEDLWIFTANTNPVIAIFYSHPLHPITRRERILITAMQMVFIINLACVAAESLACVRCGIHTCDDNTSCVVSMPEWWAPRVKDPTEVGILKSEDQGFRNLCCMCADMKLIFFIKTFRMKNLHEDLPDIGVGAALYILIANIIFSQICYQLGAMCGCFQAQSWKKRRFAERMGHVLLLFILTLLFASMPIFIDYVHHNDLLLVMLGNFAVGKGVATVGTTMFQTCVFAFLWPLQKGRQNYFVTEDDFRNYRSILKQLANAPEMPRMSKPKSPLVSRPSADRPTPL
jgi:hypothetical protein